MSAVVKSKYTCARCQTTDREFSVRARHPDEDILDWMNVVQQAMGDDHSAYAPYCRSPHCDLKIPLADDNSRIGDPAEWRTSNPGEKE